MVIVDALGLVGLLLLWGAQLKKKEFLLRHIRFLWILTVFLMAIFIFGITVWQYTAWQTSGFSKYFLPPYQGIGYFIEYVLSRFAGHWLLGALVACTLPPFIMFLNRRFGERFFEREEGYFFSLGILLTGYPGFFFYIALMLGGGLFLSLVYAITHRGRAPLYSLWFPAGVFVILMEQFLIAPSVMHFFRL
jgi:hypothetical protein